MHLAVTPEDEESIALAIGTTHLVYAQYVNRLHSRSGHARKSLAEPVPFVSAAWNNRSTVPIY